MLCGWEGNRRSGVALANHRLSGIPSYGLNGLRKGDKHPAIRSSGVRHLYIYPTPCLFGIVASPLLLDPVVQLASS